MYNECRHLFISGRKCGSPALKDQNFCFYHTTARKREKHTADDRPYDRVNPKVTALALPTLDEGDAIQLAISEVVLALAANTIDSRRARTLLYGLQIASQHYRHKNASGGPFKPSVGLSGNSGPAVGRGGPFKPSVGLSGNEEIVRETFVEEDGVEIGPEKQSPDPEDLPEKEERMTLGKFLLLEAIKDGHIDPDEIPRKEQEWKELQQRGKGFHLQAVAEERPRCRSKSHHNQRSLRTLQKHGGGLLHTIAPTSDYTKKDIQES